MRDRTKATSQATSAWLRIEVAAQVLDITPSALRRALERAAHRAADGGTEAHLDGVRGRKLGRRWRVLLGPAWALRPAPGEP